MSEINTFQDLFEHTLKDIYYAEKAILKALPKMAKKATSENLAQAFTEHFEQTEDHVQRLEQVFALIDVKPKGEKCPAIDGILEEGEELMKDIKDGTVRDAAMLAAAQAVEHYEITRYGTLVAWAEKLGLDEAVDLFQETLDEESETDEKLSELAETEINIEADDPDEEETSSKTKSRSKAA